MKPCKTCNENKPLCDFSSNGKYIKSSCKKCRSESEKKRRRTNKVSYLKGKYNAMKDRESGIGHAVTCVGKGIVSMDEFIDFALSNNDFNRIFDEWKESGFNMQMSPSIDRIDSSKGYLIGNMQFIKFQQNSVKDRVKETKIFNSKGSLCFYSRSDAAEFLGVGVSAISDLMRGKIKSCKGWVKG